MLASPRCALAAALLAFSPHPLPVAGQALATSELPVLVRDGEELAILSADGERRVAVPGRLGPPSIRRLGTGWIATAGYWDRAQRYLYLLTAEEQGSVGTPGRQGSTRAPGEEAPPRLLPSPPDRVAAIRDEPVAMVARGRLVGLAWLEGTERDRLAVHAATWTADGWGPVEVVGERGPGAQLALTGAVLTGGSWLLAWSGFDGEDDEILWSERRQDRWSPPRRVHGENRVPDISPALAAHGAGARLAWSRFDGDDYRLMVATLEGGGWRSFEVGEPGSVLPSFPEPGEGGQILYRSVSPYAWTLLELDDQEIPRRRALFPDETVGDRERPRVHSDLAGASLDWPLRGKSARRPWEPLIGDFAVVGVEQGLRAPRLAVAETRYLAFGDSITQGVGDDQLRDEKGYPPRTLERLLEAGAEAGIANWGRAGETTAEGVTRIEDVLAQEEGDAVLLMEGTNDISQKVSIDTIRFNLDQMGLKAQRVGVAGVLATVIPRHPDANTDGENRATGALAGALRHLAWASDRRLVDPFEVFAATPNLFEEHYVGGEDRVHPNATGYDLLAEAFADVLLGIDTVPPVVGSVAPSDGSTGVDAEVTVEIELYDFGAGIDLNATALLVDGVEVDPTFDGDEERLQIRYLPSEPLAGIVRVSLQTADLSEPANAVDLDLTQFTIAGTELLTSDLDLDGRVDGRDLALFAVRFGAELGEARYREYADFNLDGIIDGTDLAVLASEFGQRTF